MFALAGCTPSYSTERNTATPTSQSSPNTIDSLLQNRPFYIAHRGSGDNWPEHTAIAYRKAIASGATAIEISVNATSDGVLVCHHDRNTLRMTGQDHEIAETEFSVLKTLRNDARQWLGPSSPLEPIPRLRDVLDEHAATSVIFIEDKQGTNTQALLELMGAYSQSRQHFVWKQPAGALQVRTARNAGYKSWGYFGPSSYARIKERAVEFDFLGIDHLASDAVVRRVVATGKPVICWEVHRRSLRDRLVDLGVRGMMCSNIPYVMNAPISASRDVFASGLRGAGDLPWTTDRGWSLQPRIQREAASLLIAGREISSYCMGSMSPIDRELYEIQLEMRWPVELPDGPQHAGIAFGQTNDSPYRVLVKSPVAGYHLVLRANGQLGLFRRAAGEVSGKPLGQVDTPPVEPGQWVTLWLNVTQEGIGYARIDQGGRRGFVRSPGTKAGYFSLTKNYPNGPPIEFREVSAR
ncbi:glycerophosphodiester phosphodiesterase [Arthrobacter sp.]|uniref:glycerophosphodiester phosphodiesterase n=1 Tax=Arthrobacter sp. TaxID=1667 RepID=UPI003A8FCDF4